MMVRDYGGSYKKTKSKLHVKSGKRKYRGGAKEAAWWRRRGRGCDLWKIIDKSNKVMDKVS